MFEVGFTEILVISVLALVVLGPEKLPRVAAQIGKWVGRARTMARQFREQLEDEVTLAETNKAKAKEAERAEQDVAAAASATAGATAATATPGTEAPADSNTQNIYSGVVGDHDAASGTTATGDATASTTSAASETAHSDTNGPAPEPEATEYQPPAYAHAGANGAAEQSEAASPDASSSQPSAVQSHSPHHDDDDPPRKPGDFIIHTHERGI
jgi:sec-independent protein translocase protein TatB